MSDTPTFNHDSDLPQISNLSQESTFEDSSDQQRMFGCKLLTAAQHKEIENQFNQQDSSRESIEPFERGYLRGMFMSVYKRSGQNIENFMQAFYDFIDTKTNAMKGKKQFKKMQEEMFYQYFRGVQRKKEQIKIENEKLQRAKENYQLTQMKEQQEKRLAEIEQHNESEQQLKSWETFIKTQPGTKEQKLVPFKCSYFIHLNIFVYFDGFELFTKIAVLNKKIRKELPKSGIVDQEKCIIISFPSIERIKELDYLTSLVTSIQVKTKFIDLETPDYCKKLVKNLPITKSSLRPISLPDTDFLTPYFTNYIRAKKNIRTVYVNIEKTEIAITQKGKKEKIAIVELDQSNRRCEKEFKGKELNELHKKSNKMVLLNQRVEFTNYSYCDSNRLSNQIQLKYSKKLNIVLPTCKNINEIKILDKIYPGLQKLSIEFNHCYQEYTMTDKCVEKDLPKIKMPQLKSLKLNFRSRNVSLAKHPRVVHEILSQQKCLRKVSFQQVNLQAEDYNKLIQAVEEVKTLRIVKFKTENIKRRGFNERELFQKLEKENDMINFFSQIGEHIVIISLLKTAGKVKFLISYSKQRSLLGLRNKLTSDQQYDLENELKPRKVIYWSHNKQKVDFEPKTNELTMAKNDNEQFKKAYRNGHTITLKVRHLTTNQPKEITYDFNDGKLLSIVDTQF